MLKHKLAELINKQISDKHQIGVQVSIYQDGNEILSESYGTSDNTNKLSNNNLFLSFSVTKGIFALLIHILVDKNYLNYDDYICKFWPQFAKNGKDKITLRQILSHQAGLHRMPFPFEEKHLLDETFMLNYIEDMIPANTNTAYCSITFSWIIIGLLKGIFNDITPKQIFQKFIIDEFEIHNDAFIGLPDNQLIISRAVEININVLKSNESSETYKAAPWELWQFYNDPRVKHLFLPACNGYFTAKALAKIYEILANNGIYHNKQLISSNCINEMKKCQTNAFDDVIGIPIRKAMGFFLDLGYINNSFGHAGIGGSIAFADPSRGLGIAILINKMNFDYNNDPIKDICNLITNHIDKLRNIP